MIRLYHLYVNIIKRYTIIKTRINATLSVALFALPLVRDYPAML